MARSPSLRIAIGVSAPLIVALLSARSSAQGTDAPPAEASASASASVSAAPPELPPPPPVPPPMTASENTTPIAPPPAATPTPSTDVSATTKTAENDPSPDNFGRLVLDDGRVPFVKPEKGAIRFDVHGELQLRYENLSALKVTPPIGDATNEFVGQRNYGLVWLRIGGQLAVSDKLKFVTQFDLLPRWIVGDLAQQVSAAGDFARDEHVPAIARLRYLYLDWTTPFGLLRVGQVGNNWGMGILANNGDRPMHFGDYRMGSIVERIAFATKPAGKDSPFVIAIAGDAVLSDATSKWALGDRTYQAVLSAYYEKGQTQFGFFGVRRWHNVRQQLGDDDRKKLYVWVADIAGKHAVKVAEDVFAYGAFEIAHIRGKTDAIRSTPDFNEQDVRSWGGAAMVGVVKRGKYGPKDGQPDTYGQLVAQIEGGYASGDANPYDGVIKRFTFDPNHQVGLLMFPYVMHFHTARGATNAQNELLTARPPAGSRFLASNSGVFGATYVNPVVVFRPLASLDLKAGAVVAVSSSDVVDPYRTTASATGGDQSYTGGSPKNRDLGLELDGGFEWRYRIPGAVTLQIGAQAGVFFPGRAFDDAKGNRAKTQSIVQGRFGVQF
jgi:hypothetical protein